MLYRALRSVARIALRWFYRDIEVVGAERVPTAGPVLLVGNHQNALVDALVIGTALPRLVRLTAKATLLDHPLSRAVVSALGVVPLRRARDERAASAGGAQPDAAVLAPAPDQRRNADAFRAIVDALGDGGAVLIFPEGISHSAPALAPLKTGAARIALQARRDHGLAELPIVPIGLTFERKWESRSRVVMHVGVPLSARDIDDTPEGVTRLTARIDQALRTVTLNFDSEGDAARILGVSVLLSGVFDAVRPLGEPDPPLGGTVELAQRLQRHRHRISGAQGVMRDRAAAFVARLDALHERLRTHRIAPNEVGMSTSIVSGSWFVLREAAIVLLGGPLALWGYLHHWIPLRLTRLVTRRLSRLPDEPAMHALVAGLVFVLLFYGIVAILVTSWAGPLVALVYVLLLPIAGLWSVQYRDRLTRAHARARTFVTLRADRGLRDALLREASWLRGEARQLDSVLQEAER